MEEYDLGHFSESDGECEDAAIIFPSLVGITNLKKDIITSNDFISIFFNFFMVLVPRKV